LRGFFSPSKADDAGGLTPVKEENAARRKKDRNDLLFFMSFNYITHERPPDAPFRQIIHTGAQTAHPPYTREKETK